MGAVVRRCSGNDGEWFEAWTYFPIPEDFLISRSDSLAKFGTDMQNLYDEENVAWKLPPKQIAATRKELMRALGDGLTRYIQGVSKPDKRRVVLKTPWMGGVHNVFDLFPSAPFLLLIRDGRSTVASMSEWFDWSFEECCTHWPKQSETFLSFRDTFDPKTFRYRIIRY